MAETFICYTAMSTFYGCRATVHRVNATEHDTAYGAAPVRAIAPLSEVSATERDTSAASWQNVATEHFHPELPRAVCLSLADVATLRDAEKARTPQRSPHKLARETPIPSLMLASTANSTKTSMVGFLGKNTLRATT